MKSDMIGIQVDIDVHKMIEANRSSFKEAQNSILRRLLAIDGAADSVIVARTLRSAPAARNRAKGRYNFTLLGEHHARPTLKEAYLHCLILLHELSDDFLPRLAKVELRGRRIVAKEPRYLYKNSPHLAEKGAELLADGWWADRNLSRQQAERRLEEACVVAGLKFGDDLDLDFPNA